MSDMEPPDFDRRRDARERRFLYLDEWRLNVDHFRQERSQWVELSSQFAQVALRAAIYLNGGALVAVPPLMQWLEETQRIAIFDAAIWFVYGVMAGTFATFIGYLNFQALAELSNVRASMRATEIRYNYYPPEDAKLQDDPEYVVLQNREKKFVKVVDVTQYAAIAIGLSSYGLFCWGIYTFKMLAGSN
ncbi:MAG: hypothetical protein HEP70_14150 [Rhodobiaceae bacterium]|nr:hypothetical protein [Rhodobiaceae bacterium]